ncbi:hypothetical protein IC582_025452 [Cucumis melo]
METMQTIDFSFQVRKCQPELIAPANPTPYEFKQLSDVDDQQSLRFQLPLVNIYHHNPSLEGRDPVKVISGKHEILSHSQYFTMKRAKYFRVLYLYRQVLSFF